MRASLGMWEEIATECEAQTPQAPSEKELLAPQRTVIEQFADEQILGLIRGVFFGAGTRPARHVVFSGIREDADSKNICMRIAEVLASQTPDRVCVVEAGAGAGSDGRGCGGLRADGGDTPEAAGAAREASLQLKRNLWLVGAQGWRPATIPWIRRRLVQLREQFEYAVIQAPPLGTCYQASLMAELADGLVLVLEARRTRRLVVKIVQQRLQAANVRILGAVLSRRVFPIPERLYWRL